MAPPTVVLSSGHKMPVVGLGTLNALDEKELEGALGAAIDLGYRHIDTAFYYRTEPLIGRILKKFFDSGKVKREDLFITTKLPGHGIHPDKVETHLKMSLEKLQLDYVDLYLIHIPMHTTDFGEGGYAALEPLPTDHIATWKKLEEQVDLGRAKSIGVSSFNKNQVARLLSNSRIKPAANQIESHIYLQQPELVKYLQDNGILVISFFTFCSPGQAQMVKEGKIPPRFFHTPLEDPTVKMIAEKHKKSPAQILLKFQLQKNIAVIPGIYKPYLKENIDLFNFTLDADDLNALKGLDKGEEGRCSKLDFSPAIVNHPEYPFPRPKK